MIRNIAAVLIIPAISNCAFTRGIDVNLVETSPNNCVYIGQFQEQSSQSMEQAIYKLKSTAFDAGGNTIYLIDKSGVGITFKNNPSPDSEWRSAYPARGKVYNCVIKNS
ncbi:MAG: hypothetical protein V7731_19410 [Amphritea sp.]